MTWLYGNYPPLECKQDYFIISCLILYCWCITQRAVTSDITDCDRAPRGHELTWLPWQPDWPTPWQVMHADITSQAAPPFKNANGDKVTLAILYTNISVLNVNTLILLCRNNISGPNLQLQQECPTSCACWHHQSCSLLLKILYFNRVVIKLPSHLVQTFLS